MIPGPIIFYDLETTGVNSKKDEIIQIGAIVVLGGVKLSTFERKLQFDKSMANPEALEMNSYVESVWDRDAVSQEEGLQDFADFLDPYRRREKVSSKGNTYHICILAGFNNGSFDGDFLWNSFSKYRIFKAFDSGLYIDTRPIAMEHVVLTGVENDLENLKLVTLCEYYGIELIGAHDALSDAIATADLYFHILEERKSLFLEAANREQMLKNIDLNNVI